MKDEVKLCACGKCGKFASPGKKYIRGHSRKGKVLYKGEFVDPSIVPKTICECSFCGKYVKLGRRFISGHNSKGRAPWNKGLTKETDSGVAKYGESRKGILHTEETKQRMSESAIEYFKTHDVWNTGLTKETDERVAKNAEKLSAAAIEYFKTHDVWNKGLTKETDPRMAEIAKKISVIVTKAYLDGKMEKVGYGISGWYFSEKNNKKLYYRSSYELIAYKLLEQMLEVKSYEVEPFGIKYMWENSIHRTIPDILITYTDGTKELVEVKPEWRLEDERTKLKLEAMENYSIDNNMDFSIWSEKELGL